MVSKRIKHDLLQELKNKIKQVLVVGPACLSLLSVKLDLPLSTIIKALKEMPDSVEKRCDVLKNPGFQMWGIARPYKPPTQKKSSSFRNSD